MRKSIIMGLGLALTLAGIAAAQQPDSAPRRHDRGSEQRGGGEWGGRGQFGGPGGLLFKDITLSDAQKNQLKELRKAQHDKMTANRDQFEKEREQVRAAREKGDTATIRALMQRRHQAMEQERAQELAAVRNILTANQRTQFDKNVAELKQREAQRDAQRGPRGDRGGRRGFGKVGN